MKLLRNLYCALAATLLCSAMGFIGGPILAATVVAPPVQGFHPDLRLVGINAATASYTNATTSYTDIAGTLITVPATTRDYSLQYLRVCFSADATKSTSTTGTIQVYANGAGISASRRTIASAAGQGNINECYTVQRSSGAVQTVKLQAVSGDSASFAVANAQIEVWLVQNASM